MQFYGVSCAGSVGGYVELVIQFDRTMREDMQITFRISRANCSTTRALVMMWQFSREQQLAMCRAFTLQEVQPGEVSWL